MGRPGPSTEAAAKGRGVHWDLAVPAQSGSVLVRWRRSALARGLPARAPGSRWPGETWLSSFMSSEAASFSAGDKTCGSASD